MVPKDTEGRSSPLIEPTETDSKVLSELLDRSILAGLANWIGKKHLQHRIRRAGSATEVGDGQIPKHASRDLDPRRGSKGKQQARPAASSVTLPANRNTIANKDAAQDEDHAKHGKQEQVWKPNLREWLVMLSMFLPSLAVALDSDILVAILPILAESLHCSATQTFWASSAYLLAYAVCQPFLASLSDIFGRRPMVLLCIGFFFIASLICALSHNISIFIAARVLKGVGGAGILAIGQVIYTDVTPLRYRPKYYSITLLAWSLGNLFGPVIGAGFASMSRSGWRWCFWLNLPIMGLAFIFAAFNIRLHQPEHTSLSTRLKQIDWLGGIFFIASIASLLIGATWGGNQFSWSSSHTLGPIIAGGLGILLSLCYEFYIARHPFMNVKLWHSQTSIILFATALLHGLVFQTVLYYVCFYFVSAKLQTPVRSGIAILPGLCLAVPGSIATGFFVTKLGKYRWAIWSGWTILTLACGLLLLLDESTPTRHWAPILCLLGVGIGMTMSSTNFGVQAATKTDRDSGPATVMYTFMRSTGTCLGVNLGGTVFQNQMQNKLHEYHIDESIATNAAAYVEQLLKRLSDGDNLKTLVLRGYVSGFRGVWVFVCVVAGVAGLMSLGVKEMGLDRALDGRYAVRKERQEEDVVEERRSTTERENGVAA